MQIVYIHIWAIKINPLQAEVKRMGNIVKKSAVAELCGTNAELMRSKNTIIWFLIMSLIRQPKCVDIAGYVCLDTSEFWWPSIVRSGTLVNAFPWVCQPSAVAELMRSNFSWKCLSAPKYPFPLIWRLVHLERNLGKHSKSLQLRSYAELMRNKCGAK